MDQIKEQLTQLTLKLRHNSIMAITDMTAVCPINTDITLPEFLLLKNIPKNTSEHNFNSLAVQNSQFISKSCVSKMLSSLEKKGYLVRETDKNNRRKIIVTLTEKGYKAIKYFDNIIDDCLTEYINAVGEDYLKQFFEMANHLFQVNQIVKEKIETKYFKTNQVTEE